MCLPGASGQQTTPGRGGAPGALATAPSRGRGRDTGNVAVNLPPPPVPAPIRAPAGFGVAKGPFEPTWESLSASYRIPDWYRDAKLGIWAHWGPQMPA